MPPPKPFSYTPPICLAARMTILPTAFAVSGAQSLSTV
jgi:hypothetical protein